MYCARKEWPGIKYGERFRCAPTLTTLYYSVDKIKSGSQDQDHVASGRVSVTHTPVTLEGGVFAEICETARDTYEVNCFS